ncbi:Maf family protein [Thalassotalea sp. PLHSN55]|uniref:Maf family protein n=1 Tax=Thalassotalea sp. PLHSN55 TaxID=3435888 RepID=UPI003F868E60
MNHTLILASKSPRRQQLLAQLGYQFSAHAADIDESVILGESPEQYVSRLAVAKAQVIAQQFPNAVVLGSDTSVVIDGEILGKPSSEQDCFTMLKKLSGRKHQVLTSIAIVQNEKVKSDVVCTEVFFKDLSDSEISRYWQSGEPQDKAGSYGIQGIGAQFVKKIQGCYFSVVGLPLYQSAQMLAEFGLATPIQSNEKEIS